MVAFSRRWVVLAVGLVIGSVVTVPDAVLADDESLTFEQHVRPILKAHCFHCHGEADKPKGQLDLRLVRLMRQGGSLGEAIVPGSRDESLLWFRVEDDEMPPGDVKLSDEEKATLAAWIDQGARTARPEPDNDPPPGVLLTEDDTSFWSFQPIQRPEVPQVGDAQGRVRNDIDAFLLEKLEAHGLGFAPEADKRTLIRRASFALHGLPPKPEEVEQFLADTAPDAYDRLIDRLLASPRYGERWARHWLDVAGYADSDGYTPEDPERKYAYKYRDYIIRALNADRPWDELIREQLAGDEMREPPYEGLEPEDIDKLVATGFLRLAPDGTSSRNVDDVDLARNDVIAETLKIVSSSLLGLTVDCAQCHAHRYEPISHEDYHRLRALFEPAYDPNHWRAPNARLIATWDEDAQRKAAAIDETVQEIENERRAELEALVERVLEQELAEAPEALREPLRQARDTPRRERTGEQEQLLRDYPRVNVTVGNVSLYDGKAHGEIMSKYNQKISEVRADRPDEDFVMALTEVPDQVPTTHLLLRGDHNQPAQEILPGELTVLTATVGTPEIPVNDPQRPTTGRRLAYAHHLTSGQHPLVARVLVNRVWMHHFGQGLVRTPDDFGLLGDRPSHPELLDWLADEFRAGGWTLKRLHKMIMTSSAYRQSSKRIEALEAVDPENRLLGRMTIRRLEAEAVRDALLATSGRLSPRMFGPPVPVSPDETGQIIVGVDNRDSAGRPTGDRAALGEDAFRRSLYVQVRRSMPLTVLEPFDPPALSPNCARRDSSTIAPQALMMMNNEFVIEQAEAFADRVEREAGDDPASQVRRAWFIATAQEPDEAQVESAVAFLDAQRADFAAEASEAEADSDSEPEADDTPSPERRALASFCHALLSSNSFLYVD